MTTAKYLWAISVQISFSGITTLWMEFSSNIPAEAKAVRLSELRIIHAFVKWFDIDKIRLEDAKHAFITKVQLF